MSKKLTTFEITNEQKNNTLKQDIISFNQNTDNQALNGNSGYRIIVFEGNMNIRQSDFSISNQINLTQGGTGLHAIETFDNKNQISSAYKKLIMEAFKRAKNHHANLIKRRYPNLSDKDQDQLINFKITAIILVLKNNEYAFQDYATYKYNQGEISLCETHNNQRYVNNKTDYNQEQQKY